MTSTELSWFPLRATYSREQIVKEELDRLGIENFLPMTEKWIENGAGEELRRVPAVHNLIFVHSTPSSDGKNNVIIRIPDAQMSVFLQLASYHNDNRIVFFENMQFVSKPGPKVEVIEGDFAGVKGEIKRVRGNRCVAVSVEGVAAVGIMNLPKKHLRYLRDDETGRINISGKNVKTQKQ